MQEKTIWITGASTGIGKSLALKFLNENYSVVGSARRDSSKVFDDIEPGKINNFKYYQNDVSDYDEVIKLGKKLNQEYDVDCLINNAGVTSFKPFIENSIDDIDKIIKINLNGPIYTIKSILPYMIEKGSGTIINILSVAAKKVFTNSSIYAASKAGLEHFSKVLREELREKNIRIINIFPGATSTDIWPEDAIQNYSNKMMSPDNLANLIFDLYSKPIQICPEEVVVRPITGDL